MANAPRLTLPRVVAQSAAARFVFRTIVGYHFHRYFEAVPADTDALRDEVFRIRYEVYCEELRWEEPGAFPDGLERDAYDDRALHSLLRYKADETFAGCVRLVTVNPGRPDDPLPFEQACAGSLYRDVLDSASLDRQRIGEISRLAVRGRFRRRAGERATSGAVVPEPGGNRRRRTPPIAMGLYFAAAASGLITGMNGVFALMEPRLAKRLLSFGLVFTQVGDAIEHRGLRAPFYISKPVLYANLTPPTRGFLEVIEADLRRSRNADASSCDDGR